MTELDQDGALAAYWRFFEMFNTRDAYNFSVAMSYPHVRVSWAREAVILADIESHALSVGWDQFIATGWDHTVGKEPTLLGISENKAHVAGGWTRYTKDEKPILSNLVCYIITRVDDQWGIQCRFGTDSRDKATESAKPTEAHQQLVYQFLDTAPSSDADAQWETLADDLLVIDVGQVKRYKRGERLGLPETQVEDINVVYSGDGCITLSVKSSAGDVLLYLTKQNEDWNIRAGSWL